MMNAPNYGVFGRSSAQSRSPRPDILELIGPRFDRPRGEPAAKTLLICAGPRTGSYELARMLLASGIGIPHEYFHPNYAAVAASRWKLPPDPLAEERIEKYIEELRRRRSAADVFGTKLQYWQFQDSLCNKHGEALFEQATVVHLFRADALGQFLSLHRAMETGQYDFSERRTQPPADAAYLLEPRRLAARIDSLTTEDAKFRRLFISLGIRPLFVEFERFVREPALVVENIAKKLDVPVNYAALDRAISLAKPYRKHTKDDEDRAAVLLNATRRFAFKK
jgi:LPS sulfotransferase NodH